MSIPKRPPPREEFELLAADDVAAGPPTREEFELLAAHYRRERDYHLACARVSRAGLWLALLAVLPLGSAVVLHSRTWFAVSCALLAGSGALDVIVRVHEWRHNRRRR